jgi:hypothetical protein
VLPIALKSPIAVSSVRCVFTGRLEIIFINSSYQGRCLNDVISMQKSSQRGQRLPLHFVCCWLAPIMGRLRRMRKQFGALAALICLAALQCSA